MRYFMSILVFAAIALVWREFVTNKAGDVGLFGLIGIACIGVGVASFVARLITGRDPVLPTASKTSTKDDGSLPNPAKAWTEPAPVAKLGDFNGIWLSKKALTIGVLVVGLLVSFTIALIIFKPTNSAPPAFVEKKELDIEQKNALFYLNRGNDSLKKKEYDKAIQDYDEAIRLNPIHADFYGFRGYAWMGKGDDSRAIRDFTEANRLKPNDALAYSDRGLVWEFKGDDDKAIRDYDEAIRLEPTNDLFRSQRLEAEKRRLQR